MQLDTDTLQSVAPGHSRRRGLVSALSFVAVACSASGHGYVVVAVAGSVEAVVEAAVDS